MNQPGPPTLPPIPRPADLAADPLTHRPDDMVARCGLTNHLGTVRIEQGLTSVSAVMFPPIGQGDCATATLFVGGRLFTSLGAPVTTSWRPDQVRRTAVHDGWEFASTTICVPGRPAVLITLEVTNTAATDRRCELALALGSRLSAEPEPWLAAEPPASNNRFAVEDGRLIARCESDGGAGCCGVQAVDRGTVRSIGVRPADAEQPVGLGGNPNPGRAEITLDVPAGETASWTYVQVLGTDPVEAATLADELLASPARVVEESERHWTAELEAMFTPGNDSFSGHLPQLHTSSTALRRLYWWGALSMLWFRRDSPASVLGRTYDTLMPNYWATTTFIWDYSLSSRAHSLLDPAVMGKLIRHWTSTDIHTHFGTEYLTGGPVGNWYSVNDYAMVRLVRDLLAHNRDEDLLAEDVAGSSMLDHLVSWATHWRTLRRGDGGSGDGGLADSGLADSGLADSGLADSGLADYGEIDNLLECVGSYIHEVASLNAANVWSMRIVADLLDGAGRGDEAEVLRRDADGLLGHVKDLYLDGAGHFGARQPEGQLVPVKHCYDFAVVGSLVAGDLPQTWRGEMVDFFTAELQTPEWLRALSPYDPDASFSVRPDHQWNGAYPAWPADAMAALVELGRGDLAQDWVPGLSRTANQGPPGQAHFTGEARPTINGGAAKAPPQLPYIIDWACSGGGAWVGAVIDTLFGVEVDVDGTVTAAPSLDRLDPGARLTGLRTTAGLVDVHANGAVTPPH